MTPSTASPSATPDASSLPTYVAEGADSANRADDPGAGALATGVLLLRLGVADADYRCHGQVHVLAELLADAIDERPVEQHVVVGPVTTRLEVSGPEAEVEEALEALAAWVREPDWSGRAGAVRRVLAEGLDGVDDVLAVASLSRWGRRGVGLLGLSPVGLHAVTVEDLDAWRTAYLTSANTHLVTDHPGLAERGLALLDGPAVGVPHRPGLPLPLPARTSWTARDGGVRPAGDPGTTTALTALTGDPASTRVLAALLRTRLAASTGSRPRTRTRALPVGERLLWIHEHGEADPAAVYDVVRSISRGELDGRELAACTERLGRSAPLPALARAERDALSDLLGLPPARAVTDVSLDDVVTEARECVPSLLVLAAETPAGPATGPVRAPDSALRLVQKPLLRAPGEVRSRHRSRSRGGGVLTVGEHTCEVTRTLTRDGVAWDDLVAVHHQSATRRLLVPHRGASLLVDADAWRHGLEAVAAIDAAVAPELVVRDLAPQPTPEAPSPSEPAGADPVALPASASDGSDEVTQALQPVPAEPVENEPADTEPASTEPTDTEPTDTEPTDTEPERAGRRGPGRSPGVRERRLGRGHPGAPARPGRARGERAHRHRAHRHRAHRHRAHRHRAHRHRAHRRRPADRRRAPRRLHPSAQHRARRPPAH